MNSADVRLAVDAQGIEPAYFCYAARTVLPVLKILNQTKIPRIVRWVPALLIRGFESYTNETCP